MWGAVLEWQKVLRDHDLERYFDVSATITKHNSSQVGGEYFENNNSTLLVNDFCHTEGSLHQVALQMAQYSSPPGSKSFLKTRGVLRASPYFHIDLPPAGIFTNVAQHVAVMLQGFGLQPWKGNSSLFLLVEISYYALLRANDENICRTIDCAAIPRIVIQSEQLHHVGDKYLEYLRTCHQTPTCVVWDFSDHHFSWAQQHHLDDSFMLLPTMHQSLLGDFGNTPRPLAERSWDVAFFGTPSDRRLQLLAQLQQQQPFWAVIFERSLNFTYMKEIYANAKVCLIVHSYNASSAGEYHRLVELAASGCIPVMETLMDTLGMEAYGKCGGVVFAPYESLLATIQQRLDRIPLRGGGSSSSLSWNTRQQQQQQEAHVQWWNRKIRWAEVLVTIFKEQDNN